MTKRKAYIGLGHGGKDPGAVYQGLIERDINLVVGLGVVGEFSKYEDVLEYRLSRRANEEEDTITEKANECNAFGADIGVDLHENAGKGDGAEAIHSAFSAKGTTLANHILQRIESNTGQNIRKAYSRLNANGKDYYGMVRLTKAPFVIVESAFLDNDTDNDIIDTIEEQTLMGKAIAQGMLEYLGIPLRPDVVPEAVTPEQPRIVVTPGRDDIKELQEILNNLGIRDIDGNALDADGKVGRLTLSALARAVVHRGEHSELVRWIQKKLGIKADGAYGNAPYHQTYDAIISFQRSRGLVRDGIVGLNTWSELVK